MVLIHDTNGNIRSGDFLYHGSQGYNHAVFSLKWNEGMG